MRLGNNGTFGSVALYEVAVVELHIGHLVTLCAHKVGVGMGETIETDIHFVNAEYEDGPVLVDH